MEFADPQVEEKSKTKVATLWTVVIKNDDFTPMDFVVETLMEVFHLDLANAFATMLTIHMKNQAQVGQFTREVAEMKAGKVVRLAEAEGHPLHAEAQTL